MKTVLFSIILFSSLIKAYGLEASVATVGFPCPSCKANPINNLSHVAKTQLNNSNSNQSQANRIQLGRWVDPSRGIDDPLTEIVEIKKDGMAGTGTFLANCRIITAMHVLLGMKHGKPKSRLELGETLVGDSFEFETRPIESLGHRKLVGKFIVIGHGKPTGVNAEMNAAEDWAIGYDEDCLSDRYKLGNVRIFGGQEFELMLGREFFTAGHSKFKQAMSQDGSYDLYIDSNCGVSDKYAEKFNDDFLLSNCSVWHGGSGQLLMRPMVLDGKIVIGANGQPQLLAYAIFQTGEEEYKLDVPNLGYASGLAPFSDELYPKISPFLKGDPKIYTKNMTTTVPATGGGSDRR